MIRRHADMRRPALDHLHDRPEHARHRAERRIILAKPPDAEEVPEQLVRAVDEVNDHAARTVLKKRFTRRRGDAEKIAFSPRPPRLRVKPFPVDLQNRAATSHHLGIELRALLQRPFQRREVDVDDAEAFGVAEGPFEVVEEGPDEVAADVGAFGDRVRDGADVLAEVVDAQRVVDRRRRSRLAGRRTRRRFR